MIPPEIYAYDDIAPLENSILDNNEFNPIFEIVKVPRYSALSKKTINKPTMEKKRITKHKVKLNHPEKNNIDQTQKLKLNRSGRKPNFTAEEDKELEKLVKTYGEANWCKLAALMPKWNRKQLREHYVNTIKNKSITTNFREEEDAKILQIVETHGHVWRQIANILPGRSPSAVKNRYYKKLLKKSPLVTNIDPESGINRNTEVIKTLFSKEKASISGRTHSTIESQSLICTQGKFTKSVDNKASQLNDIP